MAAFALLLGLVPVVERAAPARCQIAVTIYEGDPLGSKAAGTIRCLAEPQIVTQSGRPAYFLSGTRQAEVGPAAGIAGPGVQSEQVGTQLELLPIVYSDERVWVELNAQHRNVNLGLAIKTAAGWVPGVTEQSVRTAWVAKSGETTRHRIAARSPSDQTWVEVTVRPWK